MKRSVLQLPLFALIVAGMAMGVVTGLGRLGFELPAMASERVMLHGPILIAGVFGTLIALERAVAMKTLLGRTWTFADAAPVLSAAGLVLLLVSGATVPAIILLSAGAAVLVGVNLFFLRRAPTLDVLTMVVGAGFLLLANVAWLAERPVPFLTPWWAAFLVLTVVGERLELAKLRAHGRAAYLAFGLAVAIYVGALLLMVVDEGLGMRLSGLGLMALAAWLLRFDIATLTIRREGLPRFVAACLLSGYVWLGIAGAVVLVNEPAFAGFSYDAYLHAILLGFVFSMVFGHAPIIFPAIVDRPIGFHPLAYMPLVLLHISVALRILADIAVEPEAAPGRRRLDRRGDRALRRLHRLRTAAWRREVLAQHLMQPGLDGEPMSGPARRSDGLGSVGPNGSGGRRTYWYSNHCMNRTFSND